MALFGAKNYASIVSPLKKMVTDLQNYVSEQTNKIASLNDQKAEIEKNIEYSQTEIMKSEATTKKIGALLDLDLDENGVLDSDEIIEEPESTDDQSE